MAFDLTAEGLQQFFRLFQYHVAGFGFQLLLQLGGADAEVAQVQVVALAGVQDAAEAVLVLFTLRAGRALDAEFAQQLILHAGSVGGGEHVVFDTVLQHACGVGGALGFQAVVAAVEQPGQRAERQPAGAGGCRRTAAVVGRICVVAVQRVTGAFQCARPVSLRCTACQQPAQRQRCNPA